MSLTADDGADAGVADDGAGAWTSDNYLLGAPYAGGFAPVAPESGGAPGGAVPAAPDAPAAGVSTALLPATIDRTLAAPTGALTRDRVLDQAGDMLAGLPPELFGQYLGPTIDFATDLPEDDTGLRDRLGRLRAQFPAAGDGDGVAAASPNPNALDVGRGPMWSRMLAQAGADWSAGRVTRDVPGEPARSPVAPAQAGAEVVDDGDGEGSGGVPNPSAIDVGASPLWSQVQASALAKTASNVGSDPQAQANLQISTGGLPEPAKRGLAASPAKLVPTSSLVRRGPPSNQGRTINAGQVGDNRAAALYPPPALRKSVRDLQNDALIEAGWRIRHPDLYIQPLPDGRFGLKPTPPWQDEKGNWWVTEESETQSVNVPIPSAGAFDPAAAEASRENLETIGMAAADPLAAIVELWDVARGASSEERYRDMCLAFGVGQAALGVGGVSTAGRQAVWSPVLPEVPIEPLGGELNGLETGIEWRRGNLRQGLPWEDRLEGALPPGFVRLRPGSNTWDFHNPDTGEVISAKTLDSTHNGYFVRPVSVYNKMVKYINGAAEYDGTGRNSVVRPSDISSKQLMVAITNKVTPEQRAQIERAKVYARSRGVGVVIEYSK